MFKSIILLFLFSISIFGYSVFFKSLILYNRSVKIINIDFIYGFFFITIISLILNFFFELKLFVNFIFILGILFFLFFFKKNKYEINFISLFLISFFLIFISHNQGITYDSQLYHLQTIQYNSNFNIIFGLGNLQPHYAMNSSWHNFLSLFNLNVMGTNLIYLGNISLLSFYINELFKSDFNIKNNLSDLFLFLTTLFILIYSFFHPYGNGTFLNLLSSPEVDIPATIFFIITVYLFIRNFNEKNVEYFFLFLTSVFLVVSIKLSYLGVIFFVIYKIFLIKKNLFLDKIFYILLFSTIIWVTRNFILSGCLIFPVYFTCFENSWSMDINEVSGYSNIVQSFAKDAPLRLNFTNFQYTLESWEWFKPWFENYFLKTEFLYISSILCVLSIIIIIIRIFFLKNYLNLDKYLILSTIVILLFNLMIWLKAPEIRFGYGTVISLTSFLLSLSIINFNIKMLNELFFKTILIFFFLLNLFKNYDNLDTIKYNSFERNYDYSKFKNIYSSNDYKVFKPMINNFCNFFNGFCTYQGYKVKINKKNGFYFIKRDK